MALGLGAIVASVLLAGRGGMGPAPRDPILPDLTIAPITDLVPTQNEMGARTLRFGVTIGNIGAGELRLRARRSHPLADDWRVVQQVRERAGGYGEVATDATLVYAGDGHDHWHIREVERHSLETIDGTLVGTVVKEGFCFFDTTIVRRMPGMPDEPAHFSTECGGALDTGISMGLSIGWGDEYPWHLFAQEIDISDLPDGGYRLRAVADPFGWFSELDETNNEYWVELVLRTVDGAPQVEQVRTSAG